jgi:YHS domain-containing protein
VDEKKATAKCQHMGKTYYFRAPACKMAFDEDPAKYTGTGGHEMAGHGSHEMQFWSFTCGLGERTATVLVPQLMRPRELSQPRRVEREETKSSSC